MSSDNDSDTESDLFTEYNLNELFMYSDETNSHHLEKEENENDVEMQNINENVENGTEQQILLTNDEVKIAEKFNRLFDIFPNGDFEFMRVKCIEFKDNDEQFENFISNCLANNDFPQNEYKEETARGTDKKSLEKFQYSLQNFVKRFKDPLDYFTKCPRNSNYQNNVIEYLKDRFRIITESRIRQIAADNEFNLSQCIHCLEITPPDLKYFNEIPRTDEEISEYGIEAGDFLFEVEFVENRESILEFMKIQQDIKEFDVEKGKILGELLECECCFDQHVLAEDVFTCTNGHVFCKECFQRGVDVIMVEAKIEFPCFQECNGKFRLDTVKKIMTEQAYRKLLSRIQYREVRAAEIQGMEFCLYCDYGAIPNENDEIFNCENCLAKICRKCNKDYHYPRKCHESEEEYNNTKERIKFEEQQTYGIVRICKTCQVEFVKESGCNKMICSKCGTMLCYVCQQVITGYGHFNNNPYVLYYLS